MIVAGLVLGLTAVIHDAVVDPHNIARRLRENRGRDTSHSAWVTLVDAAAETRRAVFYAVLITAAAAVPLFFLQGESGAFLPPIVLTYLLAVAASMVVALTVTPALSLLLLANAPVRRSGFRWIGWLRRGYDRMAPRMVKRTGAAFGAAATIAVIGLLAVPFLEMSMRPSLKERDILVHIEAPPGTSLPKITEITEQAVADLGSLPDVVNVAGQVGRAVMSDQIVNVNSAEIWVKIDAAAAYDRAVAAIEQTVGGYPDVSTDVLTYSEERVADLLGSPDHDVVVRIYGEDADVLDAKATEVQALIASVDGVAEANVERALEEPTVQVEVDLARAQAAGVKPGDVRRAAATLLGGITVGNLFEQQKVFDVVVWGAPEIRQSEADIEQLLVDAPDGGHVRIGDVADVRIVPNPTVIRHESVSAYLDVTADIAGSDIGGVARDIDGLLEQVEFPLEHHAELLGGFEERQADQARIIWVAITAAIAVFLLLQAAFRSWRLAILSFCALPLAVAGGVVAALLTGGTVTLGAIAGLVAVLGIRRPGSRPADPSLPGPRARRRYGLRPRARRPRNQADHCADIHRGAGYGRCSRADRGRRWPVRVGDCPAHGCRHPRRSGHDDRPQPVRRSGALPAVRLLPRPRRLGRRAVRPGAGARIEARRDRCRCSAANSAGERGTPILTVLLVSSCGGALVDTYAIEHEPAVVESIDGSDQVRITLEEQAARRLEIETSPVEQNATGLAVPSSAVFVDPDGKWWVYTSPEPLVFVRHEIDLEREEDGVAHLTSGPPAGTEVVTVGVPELSGLEDTVTAPLRAGPMRWIVGLSLKFRFIVVALTAFLMFFGVQQLGRHRGRRLPGVRAAQGRDPHRRCRAGADRGGRVDHRPAGAVVQRDSRRRDDPVPVGRAVVADRAAVRPGNRPARGTPAGRRADRHDHADAAHLGGAAGDAPAAVGHQPGHEDRALLGRSTARPDGPVDDGVLEDQGSPAACPRCRQRADLGRAAGDAPGAGRSAPAQRAARHARAGHEHDRGRPRRRSGPVLTGPLHRPRRMDRGPERAAGYPPRSAHRDP